MERVRGLLAQAPFRWWISGGHALDLHVGETWRSHDDTDIGVCRYQLADVYGYLVDWDVYVAAAGRLTEWTGRPLKATRHENNIWVREGPTSPWRFDLNIGAGNTRDWIYRRDPSVIRSWDRAVLRSSSSLDYLAPDLQLLFKAKSPRPKDDVDAEKVIPTLDTEERLFLADHLPPDHSWQAVIAETHQGHS